MWIYELEFNSAQCLRWRGSVITAGNMSRIAVDAAENKRFVCEASVFALGAAL